jgi:hypothetical protein
VEKVLYTSYTRKNAFTPGLLTHMADTTDASNTID